MLECSFDKCIVGVCCFLAAGCGGSGSAGGIDSAIKNKCFYSNENNPEWLEKEFYYYENGDIIRSYIIRDANGNIIGRHFANDYEKIFLKRRKSEVIYKLKRIV
jgi:hypothetical protein